jgi:peptidoglycan/LPS O-acetylase OafA/YrhL
VLAKRLVGIDMLRGLAASLVAVSHVAHTLYPRHALAHWTWTSLGMFGVGLFFVISGFCIHAPVARGESSPDWRRFYLRRFIRLYPAHLIVLFASIAAAALLPIGPHGRSFLSTVTTAQLGLHLMMAHTFSKAAFFSANAVLWTLAIETHFYLAYPLFLALRRKLGTRGVVMLAFGMFVVLRLIGRTIHAPEPFYLAAPSLWWKWTLGCLAAEIAYARARMRISGAAIFVGLACVLAAGVLLDGHPHLGNVRRVLWPFCFAAAVLAAAWMKPTRVGALLASLGVASYSLYLVHPIAYHLVVRARDGAWVETPIGVALAVMTAGGLAAVFHVVVERRFMRRARDARWLRAAERAPL